MTGPEWKVDVDRWLAPIGSVIGAVTSGSWNGKGKQLIEYEAMLECEAIAHMLYLRMHWEHARWLCGLKDRVTSRMPQESTNA